MRITNTRQHHAHAHKDHRGEHDTRQAGRQRRLFRPITGSQQLHQPIADYNTQQSYRRQRHRRQIDNRTAHIRGLIVPAVHQIFSQNRHHSRNQRIAQNGLQKIRYRIRGKISVGKLGCTKSIRQTGFSQKTQQLNHQIHHQHHAGSLQYILRHIF